MQLSEKIWAFPSKNTSEGVTSWWLNCDPEPVLIDCPDITTSLLKQLTELANGRKPRILLTNKYSHGKIRQLQETLGWSVLLQEQEAYLLPGIDSLESFSDEFQTPSGLKLLWTPGPTPGSCVLFAPPPSNVLFCGRLLIPSSSSELIASRTKKTFHWTIQLRSLEKLRQWLPREASPLLASGTGFGLLGKQKLLHWDAWIEHKTT